MGRVLRLNGVAAFAIACAIGALLAVACGSNASSSTAASPTSPSPANRGPQLSQCQVYSAAGTYTLSQDVPCIGLTASNVNVDCAQHVVGGLLSSGIPANVTLRNCQFSGMSVSQPSRWTIANSTFRGGLFVGGAQGLVLQADTFTGPVSNSSGSSLVYLNGGSGNSIIGSSFDGGYTRGCNRCGADDGILLVDESGDTIQGNTIGNTWDTGIEGVDVLTNTTIADNSITNAGSTGIGSYWCTHWQADRLTGNQIVASPSAMTFRYDVGGPQCGANPPSEVFTDNTIANNTIRNPVAPPVSSGSGLALVFQFTQSDATAANNVLQGNDMGTLGILALPPQAFINGGGNTCGAGGTFTC